MKRISAPAIESELNEASLQKRFRENRSDALFFSDETCTTDHIQHSFFECEFRNVTFQSDMRGCLFADCVFDRCDFSGADFSECVFRRCEMKICRMTGTEFVRCGFQDVLLSGCEASWANFFGSKWKLCKWKEVSFKNASLSSNTQSDVRIERCSFEQCELFNTKLKGMDFSDSDISGISVGIQDVNGAVMNEEQAAACVSLLGIIVKK